MKIALIQPPPVPRDTPPFEVAMTAAVLRREGHEVFVLDVNNELYHETYKQRPYWKFKLTDHSVEPSEALAVWEKERLAAYARAVVERRPDAVVLKLENAYPNAVVLARLLKAEAPGLPVIGSGANNPDKEELRKLKREQDRVDERGERVVPFDRLILGEDELALPQVLRELGGGPSDPRLVAEGRVVDATAAPHVEDLDALPSYDFTDYELMRYADPTTLRFSISRSCPRHCAFCQDWVLGRRFRTMSAARWLEEYEVQRGRHPSVVHFRHYDRLLNGDVGVLAGFCEGLASRFKEPPVAWGGDFIVRPEMTDAVVAALARARCNSFGTGFESGSERLRALHYKDFFSNALAARVFESCRRHNIPVSLNVMVGLPGETREDFEQTARFIVENAANLTEVRLTSPTAQVQPGTPLALNPARFGLKTTEHEKWASADGRLDYAERVRRFEELCLRVVDLRAQGVRLAVNRRVVKSAAVARRVAAECWEGVAPEARGGSVKRSQLVRTLRLLGPWEHQYSFDGVDTRAVSAREPERAADFPAPLWRRVEPLLPADMAGLRVLDVGCKDGWFALELARRGAGFVLATDPNPDSIRRASFAKNAFGLSNVRVEKAHPTEPPPVPGPYDLALCLGTLASLLDPRLALEKIAESSGALLLVEGVDFRDEAMMIWGPEYPVPQGQPPFNWVMTLGCVKAMLAYRGFTTIREAWRDPVAGSFGFVCLEAAKRPIRLAQLGAERPVEGPYA